MWECQSASQRRQRLFNSSCGAAEDGFLISRFGSARRDTSSFMREVLSWWRFFLHSTGCWWASLDELLEGGEGDGGSSDEGNEFANNSSSSLTSHYTAPSNTSSEQLSVSTDKSLAATSSSPPRRIEAAAPDHSSTCRFLRCSLNRTSHDRRFPQRRISHPTTARRFRLDLLCIQSPKEFCIATAVRHL